MKVDIFTLCDSAQEYDGKLVIIGTFNRLSSTQFPTVHPELALVARIIFSETEKGKHNIDFMVKKENEDIFVIPPGHMTADITESKGNDTAINIIIKGNNIPIQSAGIYKVTLNIDGQIWDSDLIVSQVERL